MNDYQQKHQQDVDVQAKDDGDGMTITAPISTTEIDRDGDRMSRSALKDMASQIRSGDIPLVLNHGEGGDNARYSVRDLAGAWTKATVDGDQLEATATLSSESEAGQTLRGFVKEGVVSLGFSVGFRALKTSGDPDIDGMVFDKVDLMEVSAVSVPSVESATMPTDGRSAPATAGRKAKSVSVATESIAKGDEFDPDRLDRLAQAPKHLDAIERELDDRSRRAKSAHASPAIETAALKHSQRDGNAQQALETLRDFIGDGADLKLAVKSINEEPRGIPRKAREAREALNTIKTELDRHDLDTAFKTLSRALDPGDVDSWEHILRSDV